MTLTSFLSSFLLSSRLGATGAIVGALALAVPAHAQLESGDVRLAMSALDDAIVMDLPTGSIVIQTFPEVAPRHVERIKRLTREGFYDGTTFHRVIDGFMAQGGDPEGTGTGGSDYPDLLAEFTTRQKFQRGTLGMARANDPNSGNSQFFITFQSADFLNGQYTIWGQVVQGIEHVDALPRGEPPTEPGVISRVRVLGDLVSLASQTDDDALAIELESADGEDQGAAIVRLLPALAPDHVARMKERARDGFYNGLPFNRVINGIIQGGQTATPPKDVAERGTPTPEPAGAMFFERGGIGAVHPRFDPAGTQFFIALTPLAHLNGEETLWGQIIAGTNHLDAIVDATLQQETAHEEAILAGTIPEGTPLDVPPSRIKSMRVLGDLSQQERNAITEKAQ